MRFDFIFAVFWCSKFNIALNFCITASEGAQKSLPQVAQPLWKWRLWAHFSPHWASLYSLWSSNTNVCLLSESRRHTCDAIRRILLNETIARALRREIRIYYLNKYWLWPWPRPPGRYSVTKVRFFLVSLKMYILLLAKTCVFYTKNQHTVVAERKCFKLAN